MEESKKQTVWTTADERAAIEKGIAKYKVISTIIGISAVLIVLLELIFGGELFLLVEGQELIRGSIMEESIRVGGGVITCLIILQSLIFYVIRYQRREWAEGKYTDHMAACYYCTGLQVLVLLAYLLYQIRMA